MKKVATKTFLKIVVLTLATIFSTGDTHSQSTNDTTYFIHSFANDLVENPVGTYIHFVTPPKQLDSLVIKSDSSFRLTFHYPEIKGVETIEGKWKIKDGQLLLFNRGIKPVFILNLLEVSSFITAVIVENTQNSQIPILTEFRKMSKLRDPFQGWWKLDTTGEKVSVFHRADNLIPYGTKFSVNGRYKTMTVWDSCRTRSFYEKLLGLNKSKYINGKWSIEIVCSYIEQTPYLMMKDRKFKKQEFEIVKRTDTTLIVIKK